MSGKSKCPKVITIKKLCSGANITLKEFLQKIILIELKMYIKMAMF